MHKSLRSEVPDMSASYTSILRNIGGLALSLSQGSLVLHRPSAVRVLSGFVAIIHTAVSCKLTLHTCDDIRDRVEVLMRVRVRIDRKRWHTSWFYSCGLVAIDLFDWCDGFDHFWKITCHVTLATVWRVAANLIAQAWVRSRCGVGPPLLMVTCGSPVILFLMHAIVETPRTRGGR